MSNLQSVKDEDFCERDLKEGTAVERGRNIVAVKKNKKMLSTEPAREEQIQAVQRSKTNKNTMAGRGEKIWYLDGEACALEPE
ncbi:hypothetical protein H2198_007840 [Neophaeococcomyces mojaviensis]|uniref:Uncharacterized protein n=1 Tax=Neophaeococcomyces mojaviensis TaxID=3383035 RepID=A0ACC2ZYU6_9EURO|nr:hypothetical protein H2198_007840 [Knufia sp. JES_112]